jgi:SAM-dependent methyltransferase
MVRDCQRAHELRERVDLRPIRLKPHCVAVTGLENVGWLYDAFMAVSERAGLGAWRRVLAARARGRVLEVGCGTGRNLPLYRRRAIVVATDPALRLLLRAGRRSPDVPLVVSRVEQLPFADDCFDTVVSSLVFCTVSEPQRGLDEVRRVLTPGGTLRMLEHVRSSIPWVARVQDTVQPLWTRISGGCHLNRDTETLLETRGYRIRAAGRRARRSMRLLVADVPRQPDGAPKVAGSSVA